MADAAPPAAQTPFHYPADRSGTQTEKGQRDGGILEREMGLRGRKDRAQKRQEHAGNKKTRKRLARAGRAQRALLSRGTRRHRTGGRGSLRSSLRMHLY